MADYYGDHGAYASALGATPTWGVPQEGDGSSKDAATASSIGSVLFGSVPTSGTISVCGVSISTTGVLNAASADAAANTLATNINATTTAVGSTVAIGVPQLRNLVYARGPSGGAPAGTCEIMMRVGSALLNHANNPNVAIAQTLSPAATLTQFAGGSGGCWGWLINPSAIGVSNSYAACAYGVMVSSLPIAAASEQAPTVAATPTLTDAIWFRTGSGQTIACPSNTYPNPGAPSYQHQLIFDSNTKWTGDSGTGQITVSITTGASDYVLRLAPGTSGHNKVVRCLRKGGLRFLWAGGTTGQFYMSLASASGNRAAALWGGAIFEASASVPSTIACIRISNASGFSAVRFKDCDLIDNVARTTWPGAVVATGLDGSFIWEGGRIAVNHTAGSDPGPVVMAQLGAGATLRLIGVQVSGWAFGRHRAVGTVPFGSGSDMTFEGCTGITLGTTYANISASSQTQPNAATVTITTADAGLGFRYEHTAGVVDWNPDASPAYPTRSALLMDAATSWSIKLDWFAATVNPSHNLLTPRLSVMNRLADGARTITLDFLTPVAVTSRDVSMRLHYIGTDGRVRTETTYGIDAALTTPANSWIGTANYPSHSPHRLSVTTAEAVKQGTEIAVYLEATGTPPGGSGIQLYVDPEPGVS